MWQIERVSAQEVLSVRQAVLWPDRPAEFSRIADDAEGWHFGVHADGQLACIASLFLRDGQVRLRKFATLPEWQGRGLGSAMLRHCMEVSRHAGAYMFWCDARLDAVPFYRRRGLYEDGAPFVRDGQGFIRMACVLDAA